ncbi:MAG: hypothetical protein IJH37_07775 [Clostridia bacterium]|nr:hypothetical protein [Clostridia bacterium]
MEKNTERAKLYNEGCVKDKYVKQTIHYFCAAVMLECAKLHTQDLKSGFNAVIQTLLYFSEHSSDSEHIKPISYNDDLLGCFFNQKNNIPGYIFHWLDAYYSTKLGHIANYTHKHTYVYNELQRLYIVRYRAEKCADKRHDKYIRLQRRKVCKAFRSGEYDTVFKLYGKALSDYTTKQDLTDTLDFLNYLFGKKLYGYDTTENIAVGFILGRLQGRSEAIKNAFGISQSDALKMIIDNEHRTVKKGD